VLCVYLLVVGKVNDRAEVVEERCGGAEVVLLLDEAHAGQRFVFAPGQDGRHALLGHADEDLLQLQVVGRQGLADVLLLGHQVLELGQQLLDSLARGAAHKVDAHHIRESLAKPLVQPDSRHTHSESHE
jgi:hypothetical protein